MRAGRQGQWRARSAELRTALGLPGASTPWTRRSAGGLGFQLPPRQADILDVAFSARRDARPGAPLREITKDFWADLSQAVERRPWGPLRTICRNTLWYSFEHNCILSGHAHMLMMGMPRGTAPTALFKDVDLRNMAGEMFSIPIVTMLSFAFYCWPEAEWWRS